MMLFPQALAAALEDDDTKKPDAKKRVKPAAKKKAKKAKKVRFDEI